jgi:hypothetical protein
VGSEEITMMRFLIKVPLTPNRLKLDNEVKMLMSLKYWISALWRKTVVNAIAD